MKTIDRTKMSLPVTHRHTLEEAEAFLRKELQVQPHEKLNVIIETESEDDSADIPKSFSDRVTHIRILIPA